MSVTFHQPLLMNIPKISHTQCNPPMKPSTNCDASKLTYQSWVCSVDFLSTFGVKLLILTLVIAKKYGKIMESGWQMQHYISQSLSTGHCVTQQKKSPVDIKHGNSSSIYLHSVLAFFLMFILTVTGHIIAHSWLLSNFFMPSNWSSALWKSLTPSILLTKLSSTYSFGTWGCSNRSCSLFYTMNHGVCNQKSWRGNQTAPQPICKFVTANLLLAS